MSPSEPSDNTCGQRRAHPITAPTAPMPPKATETTAPATREARPGSVHPRDEAALRAFHDFSEPGTAVAAYPFLRQMETLGLVRLSEGARMGVG